MVLRTVRCHLLAAMNTTTPQHRSLYAVPDLDRDKVATESAPSGAHMLNVEDLTRCMPRMRARARSLVGSREDAEDLVQDTLVYVLKRPRMLTKDDATGYLLRALRHMWISQHR